MKKRIVGIMLCLILLLSGCGCVADVDIGQSLAEHFKNFDTDFFLWTNDATAEFEKLFEQYPERQIYLGQVTSVPKLFGTKIKIEYMNQDVSESDIDIAESESDITELLDNQMVKGVTRGFILLKNQKGSDPDIVACRDTIKKENYLHIMGMSAMECTFVTNDFTQDTMMEYTVEYMEDRDIILAGRRLVEEKVKVLADSLWLQGTGQRTVVKAIHDYIIKNTAYDSDGSTDFIDHTPYGVFAKGISVCDGYTYAAKLLLDAAGIENYTVDGKASDEDHTWNIVKIGDTFYHMDVTWDDPLNDLGRDMLIYDYFLINDEKIKEDHSWEYTSVPECK